MNTTPDTLKTSIVEALHRFIRQRPGLDYANYGDPVAYRSELRRITRDLNHARTLLRHVELSGVTGQELLDAARSGRLKFEATLDGVKVDYCTGQYFPVEYRAAVARLCASALWDYARDRAMPSPAYVVAGKKSYSTLEDAEFMAQHYLPAVVSIEVRYDGLSAGDWLRRHFRREFGRGLASRFFN